MTSDRELMQMAREVPLIERLASVPKNSRLLVDDEDGNGTTHYPVGHLCHEAAKALRDAIMAEREACAKLCDDWPNGREDVYSIAQAIRARSEK